MLTNILFHGYYNNNKKCTYNNLLYTVVILFWSHPYRPTNTIICWLQTTLNNIYSVLLE